MDLHKPTFKDDVVYWIGYSTVFLVVLMISALYYITLPFSWTYKKLQRMYYKNVLRKNKIDHLVEWTKEK